MRKFIGFFLLLAGVAFGAFAFYPESLDRETRLAEITEILAAPAGGTSRRMAEEESMRSFAPSQSITIRKPDTAPVIPKPAVATAPPTAPATTQVVQATPPPSNGWQAVVTQDGVTSSKPGDGHARYELVVNIQRELKRAGCFGGTLSGSWNANTKRAMASFMQRVNATLPVEEPDYILLTLIKGQAAASCITCPLGQTLTDGRCVPNAVIAQRKPPKAPASGFTTTTAIAEADTTLAAAPPSVTPLPGRMSVGAPRVETPAASPALSSDWKTRVVTAPKPAPDPAGVAAPSVAQAPAPAVPLVAAPVTAAPTVSAKTKTAALLEEETALPAPLPPVEEPAAQPRAPAPAVTVPLVPPAPQAIPQTGLEGTKSGPSAGLPGSKSGRAVYAPAPRPVYIAPAPRPRASSPPRPRVVNRPNPRYARRAPNTRSVQSLFMHPLGRM